MAEKEEVIPSECKSVIPLLELKLIMTLADLIGQRGDRVILHIDGTRERYCTGMAFFNDLTKDLDRQCKELITEEFCESCNFAVDDVVTKLEKLGIVAWDPVGKYFCVSLKYATEIIGTTTEELVKEKQSANAS